MDNDANTGGFFSDRLEALIAAALQDGVLTDKERELLKHRAEKEGEDWDEVEMIINARLAEIQSTPHVESGGEGNITDQDDTVGEYASEQKVKCSEDIRTAKDGLEKRTEYQYLIVNGTVYKEFSESEINGDLISEVSGIDNNDIISVNIPTCVEKIDEYAFQYLKHLEEISIPNSVTSIGSQAFMWCSKLTSVTINSNSIGENAFYHCSALASVTMGNRVTEIGESAFSGCTGLTSVIIPDSVISIGDNAFDGCSSLETVIMPSSLQKMGDYVFVECNNLKKVDFSKCDKLERIGPAFYYDCVKLEEVDFSHCISLNRFSNTVLKGCNNIRIVDFSGCLNLSLSVLDIPGNNLEKLILPPGQKSFNAMFVWDQFGCPVDTSKCTNVKVVHNEAFSGMKIKEIVLPDSVEIIGEGADDDGPFDSCSNLKTIVMPAALKKIEGTLGSSMEQLKKIDFSKVKNLKTIPKELVGYGCSKLKELIIPIGVTEIEDDAFSKISNLKRLFLPPTLESIGDLGHESLSIYCFSPSLEELEPIVYGWDDEDDWDDDDDENDDEEENESVRVNLFVLPQYIDSYISQRKAERIPEDVLTIQEIPEEYSYYYDD